MEKREAANPKRGNEKQGKSKKKQPLKVVYITNPIKFTATASEFRGLVQELTGQDADVSEFSRFAVAKAAEGTTVAHAAEDQAVGRGGAPEDMAIDTAQAYDCMWPWHQDEDVDDVFKGLGPM